MSDFKVFYEGKKVTKGELLPIDRTKNKPNLIFSKNRNDFYTIIMVDPDAPYPEKPIYKYYLHWIIINNNNEFAEYHPPSPPNDSKPHRYFFFLFKQKSILDPNLIQKIINRKNFNLDKFISENNLKDVAAVYFKTGQAKNLFQK